MIDNVLALPSQAEDANWPDPHPLNQVEIPDITKEDLPKIVGEFAEDLARSKGIPVAATAMTMLCIASGVISDQYKVHCQPNTMWKERAKFWAFLIADPGIGKTPVIRDCRTAIDSINDACSRSYGEAIREFRMEEKKWKGGKSEDKLPPERPPCRLCYFQPDDITPAAAKMLGADNPRGLLAIMGELDSIVSASDPKTKSWVSMMLSLYDGSKDTKVTKGEGMSSCRWSGAFLTTVQPDVIQESYTGYLRNGFLQRFIPTMLMRVGTKDKSVRVDSSNYDMLIDVLWQDDPVEERIFRLADDAQELADEFVDSYEGIISATGVNKYLRQHLGKHPGLFFRLCLTYHMIDHAGQMEIPDTIGIDTAEKVYGLLKGYVVNSARAFYTEIVADDSVEALSQALAEFFKAKALEGDLSFPKTFLTANVSAWKHCKSNEHRSLAISYLESLGWCRTEKKAATGRGRPSIEIILNPRLSRIARKESADAVRDLQAANLAMDAT